MFCWVVQAVAVLVATRLLCEGHECCRISSADHVRSHFFFVPDSRFVHRSFCDAVVYCWGALRVYVTLHACRKPDVPSPFPPYLCILGLHFLYPAHDALQFPSPVDRFRRTSKHNMSFTLLFMPPCSAELVRALALQKAAAIGDAEGFWPLKVEPLYSFQDICPTEL